VRLRIPVIALLCVSSAHLYSLLLHVVLYRGKRTDRSSDLDNTWTWQVSWSLQFAHWTAVFTPASECLIFANYSE